MTSIRGCCRGYPGDPVKGIPAIKGVGGAARRAAVIRRVREEMRTPVFLTDSGDLMYPNSFIGRTFHGEADIAVANATGYDAMVIGNHDFEYPGSQLLKLFKETKPRGSARIWCMESRTSFSFSRM